MVTPPPHHTHTPSLHFHSLSRSLSLLSPPSLHLCAGDARVSFLSIRFVLTSPGRAPLTLPTDDTRGGGGGRGDEEKLLSLFSQLSITLKKKRKKERPDQSNNQKKGHTGYIYIHTKEKETLLFSILLFKEGIFLPFPPLSFSTPIFSSEILVLSNYSPWTSLGFQVRHACVVCGASSFFFYYLSWLTRPPNWRRIGGKWMWMQ